LVLAALVLVPAAVAAAVVLAVLAVANTVVGRLAVQL
jgi:hypothetical protein